jgi:hypothetical protein
MLHTIMPGPFAVGFKELLNSLDSSIQHDVLIVGKKHSVHEVNETHVNLDAGGLELLEKSLEECDIFWIHRYFKQFDGLLSKYRSSKTIVIQTWGPDYLQFCSSDWLGPHTRNFRLMEVSTVGSVSFLRQKYRDFYWWLQDRRHIKTLRLADAVGFILPTEADVGIKELALRNTVDWRVVYNGVPDFFWIGKPTSLVVQIGNCSDLTQNHLDVISRMSENEEWDRVLVPMSYGRGSLLYQQTVEDRLKELECNCEVLREIVPIQEYSEKVKDVSLLVLGNIRQQALANFMLALSQGKTVVLPPNGEVAKFCDEVGIEYLSWDRLKAMSVDDLLDYETCVRNYERLTEIWSLETSAYALKSSVALHEAKFGS